MPFTQSSLYLMENRFSPKQIRRRKRQTMIEVLKRFGKSKAEKTAAKLQQYAAKVLHAPVEYVDTIHVSLAQHVKHIRCLRESVVQMDKQIALILAQTQGAFLTSVHGIGLVLAAGVTAEIGDLNQQKPFPVYKPPLPSPTYRVFCVDSTYYNVYLQYIISFSTDNI